MNRDDINSHILRELYDYWFASCDATSDGIVTKVPHEKVIDPLDIPKSCLKFITLLEVRRDPFELYVRLTGSGIENFYNKSQKGNQLLELGYGSAMIPVVQWYEKCANTSQALQSNIDFVTDNQTLKKAERIALPYCDDAGAVSLLMSGVYVKA